MATGKARLSPKEPLSGLVRNKQMKEYCGNLWNSKGQGLLMHLVRPLALCRLYGRHFHTQKQTKAKSPQSSKYKAKRDPKGHKANFRGARTLWEPFREVLPDHDLNENSTVVEDSSQADGRGPAARFWGVSPSEAHEQAADAVTPLWRLDYARQLEVKQARVRALLRQLAGRLPQSRPSSVAATGRSRPSLPCRLDKMVPSPQIDEYRNKEEYKIGEGVDGDPRTVGFLFSSPARGPPLCLPGDQLRNCKPQHARTALAFQQFVRQSRLAACSRLDDGGHWRTLLVRSSRRGQLLASVTLHPQQLSAADIRTETDSLQHFFQSGPGADCGLDALFFQECRHARCSADQAPFQVLFGPPALQDQLGHLQLLVSPGSFLQVNVPAAEALYDVVEQRAQLSPATVLLDLCCGTGPVSLLLAHHCRMCIGIEATPSAVQDAIENARINDIQNVEFVAGRVEQELPKVIADLELSSDIVAVINPGRDGVAPRVIDKLRASPTLRRVIYIACKPDHVRTSANLAALCRLRDGDGCEPFRLVRASPVDLFPHTDHLELVLTFER